jgi:hypothetical protein
MKRWVKVGKDCRRYAGMDSRTTELRFILQKWREHVCLIGLQP